MHKVQLFDFCDILRWHMFWTICNYKLALYIVIRYINIIEMAKRGYKLEFNDTIPQKKMMKDLREAETRDQSIDPADISHFITDRTT